MKDTTTLEAANPAREYWERCTDTAMSSAALRGEEITPQEAAAIADRMLIEWRDRWADDGTPKVTEVSLQVLQDAHNDEIEARRLQRIGRSGITGKNPGRAKR